MIYFKQFCISRFFISVLIHVQGHFNDIVDYGPLVEE